MTLNKEENLRVKDLGGGGSLSDKFCSVFMGCGSGVEIKMIGTEAAVKCARRVLKNQQKGG